MKAEWLHDKSEIAKILRRNVYLNLYGIGDLDDFFWPYTTWYALRSSENFLSSVAFLYSGYTLPTLIALDDDISSMKTLLQTIISWLPRCFYCHISPNLSEAFNKNYQMDFHGKHYKMALRNPTFLTAYDTSKVVLLSKLSLHEIESFYRESYPENWFDQRMLESDCYFGIRENERLVSIAGIHVYSPKYRVAALGNITTHPDFRKNGYAKNVTAKLCLSLQKTVDHIGLNVKADNEAAIACYKKLGFEIIGTYEEYMAIAKAQL